MCYLCAIGPHQDIKIIGYMALTDFDKLENSNYLLDPTAAGRLVVA